VQATYHRIKKSFILKGIKGDVENYVKQCRTCPHVKYERAHPAGLLQPLLVPQGACRDICMDFILVVVDRFSKYAHFIPLKHPFSAKDVAQQILDVMVRLHGMPASVVSDGTTYSLATSRGNCSD
jgi:hypothetical protein